MNDEALSILRTLVEAIEIGNNHPTRRPEMIKIMLAAAEEGASLLESLKS